MENPAIMGFWEEQPVGCGDGSRPIERGEEKEITPVRLPKRMAWTFIDDPLKISSFLNSNYVEDDSGLFRLCYSKSFIESLISCNQHEAEYSLGLLLDEKLIGYVLAKKHTLCIKGCDVPAVSINFLCLGKEHRSKGLAPLMIKEIKRIANTKGIYSAIFTGTNNLSFSIGSVSYYHLPLRLENLVAGGFLESSYQKTACYKFREETRLAEEADFAQIQEMYTLEYSKYALYEKFTKDEIMKSLKPRKDVMYTLYNPKVKEFASFFVIDTACLGNNLTARSAYLYYWSGGYAIISDAIAYASSLGFDMFNVINCGRNKEVIEEFDMIPGTGFLKYFLYNWQTNPLKNIDIGFVLF